VPKGELIKFNFEESKIFPGTFREVTVYVPAQYDPAQPACLYVNQDGVQYKAPTVFDNLIHRKEIPVTIGVFRHARAGAGGQSGRGARSVQPQLSSMTGWVTTMRDS
jgi:enterochelin esterase-like enzyme